MTVTLVLIAVLAFAIGAYDALRRARGGRGIAPASVLQRRFGLHAEHRPIIRLDPDDVPADLRHLIPLAEKWGVGDDIIRHDLIERSSHLERRELHDALYEPFERITEWLDAQTGSLLTPEAEAFLYMQTALDEMGFFVLEEKRAVPPRPPGN